ncbi:hypothetical protein Hanom_Chr16g01505381 [Helianthus anomalus]
MKSENLASIYYEQGNLNIATVNFNGETYESPNYCTTLRQAEHSATEVALNALASRGPSNSLEGRILVDLSSVCGSASVTTTTGAKRVVYMGWRVHPNPNSKNLHEPEHNLNFHLVTQTRPFHPKFYCIINIFSKVNILK